VRALWLSLLCGISVSLLAAAAAGGQGKPVREGDLLVLPPDVTDQVLQDLKPDPKILKIGFSVGPNRWKPRVTAKGLEALARWTHLQELGLPGQAVTDETLLKLAPLTNLQVLSLMDLDGNSPITTKGLAALPSFPRLRELWLDGLPLMDDAMVPIGMLTELRVLRFYRAPITDAGVANLSRLTLLEDLQLGESKVTDKALPVIGRMTRLRTLDLRAPVTGNGLRALAGLSELRWLALGPTVDDNAGIALAPLKNLESLSLVNAQITDSGARALAALTGLKTLDLDGTQITDSGAELLASLPNLSDLRLSRTRITDRTIDRIAMQRSVFPSLSRLVLEDVNVTPEAVGRLEKARQKLSIWFPPHRR
jgi:hypothetical protein